MSGGRTVARVDRAGGAPAGAQEPGPARRLNWRNRLLASPRFQRWAAAFPPTRRIARREARALFDITAGFVYTQVLRLCVELDLFEQLAAGPLSPRVLGARAALPEERIRLVLNAAASLRLLDAAAGGRFGLGPLGAAFRGNPGIAAMVAHHRLFYDDLADPMALLREPKATRLGQFWPYRDGAGDPAGYSALMARSLPFVIEEVLRRYRFARHRTVLDLGGGDGGFLAAVAARAPRLRLQLLDLPEVARAARARFATSLPNTQIFEGSFLTEPLPSGADLITLIRILHDHDDATVLKILCAAYRTLPPDGALLIAEPLAGSRHAAPMGDAYFGFYLLAASRGRPRRAAELFEMLRRAGFNRMRQLPTHQPLLAGIIIAKKKV